MILTEEMLKNSVYLGDGVYAYFGGIHVILFLHDGYKEYNEIHIDEYVAESLIEYLKKSFKLEEAKNNEN